MTAAPAKFKFDLDLGKPGPSGAPVPDANTAETIQKARMAGYAEGLAEGERSASAEASRQLQVAAENLAASATQLLAGFDQTLGDAQGEAIELAASVGRKLAANLLAREPTAELEALFTECLASLEGVPHLVIRCHPDLADKVRDLATARIATSRYSGRLVVMGDPDRSLSDGMIEWADGGLVRDMAAISAQIDKSIAAFMAARDAKGVGKAEP